MPIRRRRRGECRSYGFWGWRKISFPSKLVNNNAFVLKKCNVSLVAMEENGASQQSERQLAQSREAIILGMTRGLRRGCKARKAQWTYHELE